ncbi:hypothetical protein PoMZ_01162 [Pyricularia oryzae]|uniref:Uncharacterized protein n=1 Tax=Pyricularia oryzae TaxID=318829 RepID=A0A4P7N617_PYROR|nr:hypothetical protein PoMZ_01162 [Pyricularia oryzae]
MSIVWSESREASGRSSDVIGFCQMVRVSSPRHPPPS